jgi:hypothetical protein
MCSLVDPKTIWLLLTNLILGLAVVVCSAMIVWCLMKDVLRRRRDKREESLVASDYLDGLENLGVSLPDGGKRIDEMVEE